MESVRERGIPLLLCSPDTYAAEDKTGVLNEPGIIAAMEEKGIPYAGYADVLRRYAGWTTAGVSGSGKSVAVYMYGGGTTGRSLWDGDGLRH